MHTITHAKAYGNKSLKLMTIGVG